MNTTTTTDHHRVHVDWQEEHELSRALHRPQRIHSKRRSLRAMARRLHQRAGEACDFRVRASPHHRRRLAVRVPCGQPTMLECGTTTFMRVEGLHV
jgi:hypothetical protein